MTRTYGFLEKIWLGEDGATVVEYVLLIGFMALLCVTAVGALGVSLHGPFQSAINGLS